MLSSKNGQLDTVVTVKIRIIYCSLKMQEQCYIIGGCSATHLLIGGKYPRHIELNLAILFFAGLPGF